MLVGPGVPRKSYVDPGVERVALVVIEEEATGRREIRQPAADGAKALGELVGVSEVKLRAPAACRGERSVASVPRMRAFVDGEREENIGISHAVVVEEIPGAGAEIVRRRSPALEGNGHPELVFFVALAAERDESRSPG